jgi:hypothetical protein
LRVGAQCIEKNAPLDEPLIFLLADPANEAGARERLAQSVCCEAVLGEAEVEEGGDVDVAAELLLLLDEVGAANEADGDLVPELREQLQHLRLRELALTLACALRGEWGTWSHLPRLREGLVDIEEHHRVLNRAVPERGVNSRCGSHIVVFVGSCTRKEDAILRLGEEGT